MWFPIVRVAAAWWSTILIVIVGAWKTAEFAEVMAGNSHNWFLQAMAGLVYFGPFVADELTPHQDRPFILRLTKPVLLTYLCIAIVFQALGSSRSFIADRMEREHLEDIRARVTIWEKGRFASLSARYQRLLQENGCYRRDQPRSRNKAVACETLFKDYREVTEAPETVVDDPLQNGLFRDAIRARVNKWTALARRLPLGPSMPEYPEPVVLSRVSQSTWQILSWTYQNYYEDHALSLLGPLFRNLMLLPLTILVGVFHNNTAGQRQQIWQQWLDTRRRREE